jgi:Glycosyltransferase family 87
MRLRPPALLIALLLALLALPSAALAQAPQPGYEVSSREAAAIARETPAYREAAAEHGQLRVTVVAPPGVSGGPRWEVGFYPRTEERRILEVHVDGRTGRVLETWTGPQVISKLARGYNPDVGGDLLNKPYVWLSLCLLFLMPFFDPRRPFRLLHLDLLMLLGFGVSQYFANQGDLSLSVPLVYPFLLYLMGRLLYAGFRPREHAGPLVPVVPVAVLAVGLVLLLGFRVALNVADGSVIDVGYASAVGADRIAHGEELYTDNNAHGDTYGPMNYVMYVPFEALFPVDMSEAGVVSARVAAITFDLFTVVGLFLLGMRLRTGREGRRLGLALAFAWTAFPYSTYTIQAASNDGLIAMLLVFAMLALASPPVRGALVGIAAAAKFVPLALAPLFAAGTGDRKPATVVRFGMTLTLVVVAAVLAYLPDGGLRELWNATLGYQFNRDSPFSAWGLYPALEPLKPVVTLAVAALAAAMFFVPRRRDARQVAALAGAVVIAMQLTAVHWFYFYVVWFAPLALIALFAAYSDPRAQGPAEARHEPHARELEPVVA